MQAHAEIELVESPRPNPGAFEYGAGNGKAPFVGAFGTREPRRPASLTVEGQVSVYLDVPHVWTRDAPGNRHTVPGGVPQLVSIGSFEGDIGNREAGLECTWSWTAGAIVESIVARFGQAGERAVVVAVFSSRRCE